MNELKVVMEKFNELCLKKDFLQAHIITEDYWKPRRDLNTPEIFLVKAFINGSTVFALIQKNRKEASKKVWNTYLKYINYIDEIDLDLKAVFLRSKDIIEKEYKLHFNE